MADLTKETVEGLNKAIEKTNALLLTMGNKTAEVKENVQSTTKNVETSGKKTVKMFDGLYNTLDKMCEQTENIVSMVSGGAFVASFATLAKHSWSLNNNMTQLAVQMGKGRTGARELEKTVSGMMREIGSNYEQAKGLVTTLAEAKYSDNLKEAAMGADLFSRATGVASESVAQLTVMLNRQGDLSAKSSNAILAGMTKVQQKVGISRAGMEALTQQISDMAYSMAAFGKTSDEISRAAVKTTAFVGALEKVGVSASRAVEMINQLTDPDRIEDNILLYSQLGLSIEDAISGGAEAALNSGAFKEMADRIMSMGPIAGSQFAKSMGLSYKEVSRMAKMEAGGMESLIDEATTPEEKSIEALKQLTSQAEGLGKKIENFFNKIQGWILGLGPMLLTGLALITPKIIKLFKGVIEKLTVGKEGIQASVETSIERGVKAAGNSGVLGAINRAAAFSVSGQMGRSNQLNARTANIDRARAESQGNADQAEGRLRELQRFGGKNLQNLNGAQKFEYEALMKALTKYRTNIENLNILEQEQYKKLGVDYKVLNKAQNSLTKVQNEKAEMTSTANKALERLQALERRALSATSMEMKNLAPEIAKSRVEYEKQKSIVDDLNKKEERLKSKIENLELGNINKRPPRSILGNLASGAVSRVRTGLGGISDRLTEGGTLTKGQAAGKIAIKGIGGLGKALGGLAKTLGPMAIVMSLIGKVLDKLKEPIENLVDNLMNKLQPVFDAVMPILSETLNVLVKALLPPLLKITAAILSVLHVILKPINMLIKALGNIPGLGFLKSVADGLDKLTGPEVTGALSKAADNIANSNEDLTKATTENTEATEKVPTITAVGGRAVMTNQAEVVANPGVSSTTQAVKEQMTDAEKNKEAQKSNSEKESRNQLVEQTATMKDLRAQMDKMVSYLAQMVSIMGQPNNTGNTFSLTPGS